MFKEYIHSTWLPSGFYGSSSAMEEILFSKDMSSGMCSPSVAWQAEEFFDIEWGGLPADRLVCWNGT